MVLRRSSAQPYKGRLPSPLASITIMAKSPRRQCHIDMRRVPDGGERYGHWMQRSPYRGHRFPPEIIRHAVWLYLRFTLSFRDVEDLLAERGLDISYETIRRWVLKFGPRFARELRRRRTRPSSVWHLDEMSARSGATGSGSGEPSITRARCSISSSSDGETRRRP